MPGKEFVLWGILDAIGGPAIRITGGDIVHCKQQKRSREQEGRWSGLAIYLAGTPYPPELQDGWRQVPLIGEEES